MIEKKEKILGKLNLKNTSSQLERRSILKKKDPKSSAR